MSALNRLDSVDTKFRIQANDLPAGTTIASATQAKPCVLTFGTAPPAEFIVGAIVVVEGAGWRSLDGRPFQVVDIAGMAVTLGNSDTSKETVAMATGATAAAVPFTEECFATVTFATPQGTQVDLTTMCDHARVTKPGLPGLSTWQGTGFWDATDAAQARLRELLDSRQIVVFENLWNDTSGLTFTASVSSLDIRAGVDQGVGITVGGTLSGKVAFVAPIAP